MVIFSLRRKETVIIKLMCYLFSVELASKERSLLIFSFQWPGKWWGHPRRLVCPQVQGQRGKMKSISSRYSPHHLGLHTINILMLINHPFCIANLGL